MHEEQKNTDGDLNTEEIKRIARVEASIETRLERTKIEAGKIISNAREDAENALETAREEAALVKAREIERIRLEEIETRKLLIKQAGQTAAKIASQGTEKVSKKLFE